MKLPLGLLSCVGLCLALAGPAAAAEPDVIVSTVGSTLTKNGTVGSITGYSMTTVSCNIGNVDAIWLPNSSDHPVIGQQMYRLLNGRFEQIGMSWLKHGFCAADAPNCTGLVPGSAYAPNASCDWLGPFATDTYSASLNGQQSNLGPRSEINPATGDYPYPYVLGANASGNAIYKRLQITNSDLDPALNAGGRYFAEVHYVTTDESQNARRNNASYREVLVGSLSAGGYNLSFSGATVPMKAAIEAWQAIDPSVQLSNLDIPGDGRIVVASKASDLGGGLWQYEYAVYNHNSNLGVGGFSVPKASAVSASSLGFHDVSYHSGEAYDGTDWAGVVNSGNVGWATTPFATNPNANAIRWSTTYNFRFQANQAPVLGTVSLTRFKDGVVHNVGNTYVPGTPIATGSCCIADGSCSVTTAAACTGTWTNAGSCSPNICPAPTGACCTGTTCAVTSAAGCSGTFQGNGSACGAVDNPTTCCPANFNQSGGLSVQDIFDFLAAYFANDPAADFNAAGGLTVQDIFDFLAAYFTGC